MLYPQITKGTTIVPPGTPDRTLFACVTGSYRETVVGGPSLGDCARGYWTNANVKAAHAEDCDWIFAHKNQKVVGVFRINRAKGWVDARQSPKTSSLDDRPDVGMRMACEVTFDPEMTNRFLDAPVHLGGTPNPLRGYFVDIPKQNG